MVAVHLAAVNDGIVLLTILLIVVDNADWL
jgi:hypothetical protein